MDKATVSTKCVKKRSRMEKVGRTRKSLSLKKKTGRPPKQSPEVLEKNLICYLKKPHGLFLQ